MVQFNWFFDPGACDIAKPIIIGKLNLFKKKVKLNDWGDVLQTLPPRKYDYLKLIYLKYMPPHLW